MSYKAEAEKAFKEWLAEYLVRHPRLFNGEYARLFDLRAAFEAGFLEGQKLEAEPAGRFLTPEEGPDTPAQETIDRDREG